jgi:hypothetical protein
MARTGRVDRDRVVGAVSMDPCRGAGEVDTGTVITMFPVSGAARRFRAEGGVSVDQRRESRGLADVNNRFPAFAAVIGAHQIALQTVLVTTGQASQFLDRMFTEWRISLLAPLRL